jgi:hypothetical protein
MAKKTKETVKKIDDVKSLLEMQKKLQRSFDLMAAKVERLQKNPRVPLELIFNATVVMNQVAEKIFEAQERRIALEERDSGEKTALKLADGSESENVPFGFAAYNYYKNKGQEKPAAAKPN